ncbi:MAG: BatA domain-containing protein, partial [Myxococcales bacterium]
FIALGDHVDPDAYNDAFGDLLPRPLHLIKTAAEPGAQGAEEHAARFGVIEWAHPLFRVFGPAEREGLETARTFRYALLKPEGQAHTLASYDDGAPALIERRSGSGRVLLYTSSASRTWTDWPIRVSFLPVLQQAVSWLADALEQRQPAPGAVGGERILNPPAGTRVAKVLGPAGEVAFRRETSHPDDGIVPLAAPGQYHALVAPPGVQPHEEPTLTFVATLDPKESDLRRVDEAELKSQLGGSGSAQVAASSAAAQGRQGTPLWSGLLLLGALALLGEGALTRR